MKKYDVYGVGNALVDMEFEVSEDFLKKMTIDKGLMTLVDEQRQADLINALDGSKHKRSCGGSAANTMIAVKQFGGRSFYSCKVADDETGTFYFEDLVKAGVQTNLHSQRADGITGKCLVLVTPDADRTMNTFLGITEQFSAEEIIEEDLIDSEYLYIEGYLVTSSTGQAAAIKAREVAEQNGVKTALTMSDPNMVNFFRDGLQEMIGPKGVDLVFCNEKEAKDFAKEEDVFKAAEKLKEVARSVAITLGPKGALIWDGSHFVEVITERVEPVDTNGAGDLFAGAYLYGINNGLKPAQAGKLACSAASKLVTQFGARLRPEQAEEVKKSVL